MSIVFAFLKEKGAMLISGFNTLPKEEREQYDMSRMSKDMRNSNLLWGIILLTGGIISYYWSFYFASIALVIWLILFFKDVNLDADKAFNKYKL